MIEQDIINLLPKLFNDVNVQNLTIQEAVIPVESDTTKEYDIVINENRRGRLI